MNRPVEHAGMAQRQQHSFHKRAHRGFESHSRYEMWATQYIALLQQGQTVKFRPHGNSMQPRIESGQLVTVTPCKPEGVKVGDVVLCKVDGKQWLHLVSAIGSDGRFQISNNKGHINGWTTLKNVFGVVTAVEN